MLSAVLIFGMLMQPKVPHHAPSPVHHSAPAPPRHVTTPAPSSKPVEQAPSPVQAHHVSNSVVTPATQAGPYYSAQCVALYGPGPDDYQYAPGGHCVAQ